MGSPRSGKRALAARLAKHLDYVSIDFNSMESEKPTEEKFSHLDKEVKGKTSARGFVISGYGADCDAEIQYLNTAFKQLHLSLVFVVFLELTWAEVRDRNEDKRACTTMQMSVHAIGYETCSTMFSEQSNFVCVTCVVDGVSKTGDEIFEEVKAALPDFRTTQKPLEIKPAHNSQHWSLIEDFNDFKKLSAAVDAALGSKITTDYNFPLRTAHVALDYSRFVRYHSQLKLYDVMLHTNGMRVVVFRCDGHIYYIPEDCTAVFKMKDDLMAGIQRPPATTLKPGTVDLVLEAEQVVVKGSQGGQRDHLLVGDVLYYDGKRGDKMLWKQRKELLGQLVENTEYVLVHKHHAIANLGEMFQFAKVAEEISIGIRFIPPHPYKLYPNTDHRYFYWTDLKKPAKVVARLWCSKETTRSEEKKKEKVPCWAFALTFVDDNSGEEAVLPGATVFLSYEEVEKQQINDGQMVECEYDQKKERAAGPRGKGGVVKEETVETWTFTRRRQDMPYPMYLSTVRDIQARKGWDRELLEKACSEFAAPK